MTPSPGVGPRGLHGPIQFEKPPQKDAVGSFGRVFVLTTTTGFSRRRISGEREDKEEKQQKQEEQEEQSTC